MKVQKTQKVFTPVQLNITFETEEEYVAFSVMMRWNKTIPLTLYPGEDESIKRVLLQDVMQSVVNVL